MPIDIAALRSDYTQKSLDRSHVADDAILQFTLWFEEAIASEVLEPNAMSLATVKANGQPSCRIVLLKGIEDQGFVFYTNYTSHKGAEINHSPLAALTFFWPELERQVRIEGQMERVPEAVSDAYFASRPYESQLGAWVSPQSQVIPDRDFLENRLQELKKEFENKPLTRPPHWGGFLLRPSQIEFWQGRASRLHDRLLYQKEGQKWTISRLAP